MIFEIQRIGNSGSILLLSFHCKGFDIDFLISKKKLFDALDVELEKKPVVKGVIINLEGIKSIDDSGCVFFLSLLKYLFMENKVVNVTGLSKNLRTVFELARMNHIVQCHTNVSEAEISLNESLYPENTAEGKVTVPHPKKDLAIGTLRSIFRQAGWEWR